jgi:tetratricopeptide (TPR) repeat protein
MRKLLFLIIVTLSVQLTDSAARSTASLEKHYHLKNPRWYLQHAWSFRAKGNYGHAIDGANEAISEIADKPDGYFDSGMVYFESGKYELAEADFRQAVQLNPDYAHALLLHYLASAHLGTARLDEIAAAAKTLSDKNQANSSDYAIYALFLNKTIPQLVTARPELQAQESSKPCDVFGFTREWHLLRNEYNEASQIFGR